MMEDDLIIKYLMGEATAAERSEMDDWLAASEQHRQRLASFLGIWELAGKLKSASIPDRYTALEKVKKKIFERNVQRDNGSHEIPLKRGLRIGSIQWQAAVVIGCLLSAAAVWLLFKQHHEAAKTANIVQEDSAVNNSRTDSLPDGTLVTLNPLAKIGYAKGLAGVKRTVTLQGDAFFAVAHDALRPFVVLAKDIVITDIGTSFNVRNYADTIEIMVATGIVSVKRDNDSVILRAGERLVAVAHSERLLKQIIQPVVVQPSPKKQKRAAGQLPSSEESREMMREIINDLVTEKIVAGKDSLSWFGLDSSQFVVDGRSQPAALHEKFRRKYLKISGYGYFYGPVKVYGQGVFFEKKDLYK